MLLSKVQFNPRSEREILVTPMRHAAVVVTLATNVSSSNEQGGKFNAKEKDGTENKDMPKESVAATHHVVPLEDEVC